MKLKILLFLVDRFLGDVDHNPTKLNAILFILNRLLGDVQQHPEAIDDAFELGVRQLHDAVVKARQS